MTSNPSPPLVIAHRGAPRDARGNSVEAFEAAIAQGADSIETDVRRTADGVLVIHHDRTRRIAPVSTLTNDQLGRRSRRPPPSLEQALELFSGRVGLDLEIKAAGFEAQVLEAVSERFSGGPLLFTSFDEDVIRAIKRIDPRAPCGLVLGPARLYARTRWREVLPFDMLERSGADTLVLHRLLARVRRYAPPAGSDLLAEAERRGVPVIVWTVNAPHRLRGHLADPRVSGIITDVPGLAVEIRGQLDHDATPPSDSLAETLVTEPTRRSLTQRVRPDSHG